MNKIKCLLLLMLLLVWKINRAQVIVTVTNPTCYGYCNGSANFNLSLLGGTPPYSVMISSPVSNQNGNFLPGLTNAIGANNLVTDLCGSLSNYTYLVFDANLNFMSAGNFAVSNPLAITLVGIPTPSTCGSPNGSIRVIPISGTAPLTYYWSNGISNDTISNLLPGEYQCDVVDANGCMATNTFHLSSSGGPTITNLAQTNVTCNGLTDGTVTLGLSGGVPPYTQVWNDMDSSYTALSRSNLAAGKYMFSATDANGCSSSSVVTITAPAPIAPGLTVTKPNCNTNNGSLNLNPSGGNGSYTYQWSSNAASATTSSVSNLPSDLYSVQISDGIGCSKNFEIFLNDTSTISITDTIISAPCNSMSAAINIGISGGTSPYSYNWSTGDTTQDVSGLNPGFYSLVVTDALGCKNGKVFKVFNSYIPEICALTVDTSDNRNIIYWDKTNSGSIKEFKIYRESVSNFGFLPIGTVPYDSLSQFKDPNASAVVHSWKYLLTAIDSCGNETGRSYFDYRPYHLYVDTLCGGNCNRLVWSNALGISYTKTYIFRKTPSTAWQLIDSVSMAAIPNNNYIDPNPPAGSIYMLETNVQNACNISYRINETAGIMSTIKKSRSNINNNKIQTLGIETLELFSPYMNIYPNPAKDEFFIRLGNARGNVQIEICDVTGRVVERQTMNDKLSVINCSHLSHGVYFINAITEGKRMVKKIVIEK